MYYIWSLLVTIALFAALQYKEYEKDKTKYNLYSYSNLSTIIIIYLISTILFYMLLGIDHNCLNKINKSTKSISKGGYSEGCNSDLNIDPVMLRRIPDQMYTGFDPYHDVE